MHFRPVDEMSLRHLFSSRYGEEILKMSYLGPVLSESNTIESSPDCLILDRRGKQWEILRCEFKYVVHSKDDFANNGLFDMAIVWGIPRPLTKQRLQDELANQNGCSEIIILSERKAFSDLKAYHVPTREEFYGIRELRNVLLRVGFPAVFAAYVAASISPNKFDMRRMVIVLSERFPEVRKMQPQGRANVVSKLLQTKPPLIKWLHDSSYRWDDSINATIAIKEMEELITTRFCEQVPSSETIALFE